MVARLTLSVLSTKMIEFVDYNGLEGFMRKTSLPASALMLGILVSASGVQAASLTEAATLLSAQDTKTIQFTASGQWYQFGQAPAPGQAWPRFDVSSYDASYNYDIVGADVKLTRKQTIDPARLRPTPVEQSLEQLVSGHDAWNLTLPPNAAPDARPVATLQPFAPEERLAEIWASPQGFLRAALANNAESKPVGTGVEVSFTLNGKYRFIGTINAANQVEKVKTCIDNPVLGDTVIETTYSDYKDFGGIQFPAHLARTQGGFPVLDLTIASVKANPVVDITLPGSIATLPVQSVAVTRLDDGVYYLTGGTHHSVAIEQKDHVVLVEAPLNEDRSLALIEKIKEIIPNKPIKYVINSHSHFDHAGGLRTFVAQGATIVTHKLAADYYKKVWAGSRRLTPDLLAKSPKPAKFETFTDDKVLAGGPHKIEVHLIAKSGHADDFALVYLPKEKILIEGDAYTPTAANAPPPATPNPYSVNLYDNIKRLKLDVAQIAALHGPRVATLADLKAYIGQP